VEKELYYEDFAAGQQFRSRRSFTLTKDDIIAFARLYDPQPQHTSEEEAKSSVFGELVASGWHTAATTMRLKAETDLVRVAGGLVGLGLDKVRWPRPTMPGDSLSILVTVLEKRVSESLPGKGIVRYKVETLNQKGELAMEMLTAVIVPIRDPARR
jgi:acyl dehydratase